MEGCLSRCQLGPSRVFCAFAVNLLLHEQLPGHVAEGLGALLGDAEAFADLDDPSRPSRFAGMQWKVMFGLRHGLVAGAQARRVLAPVRAGSCSRRSSRCATLLTMPCRAITARQAASTSSQVAPGLAAARAAFEALDDDLLGVDQLLRRLAEEDRARLRAVIAVAAGAELQGSSPRPSTNGASLQVRCGVEVPMPVGSIGTNEV